MTRSKMSFELEPVMYGLQQVDIKEGYRYDLIANRQKKTCGLVLQKLDAYPEGQQTIIPVLPLESFLDEFRKWYKTKTQERSS